MKKIVCLSFIFLLLGNLFCSGLVFSKYSNLEYKPNFIFNKVQQKLENIEKNMVLNQNNISFDLKIREENGEWIDENLTTYVGSIIEFKIKIDTNRGYPLSLTAALVLPITDEGPMFDYLENSDFSSKKTFLFDASDEGVFFLWFPVLLPLSITCTFKARIQEVVFNKEILGSAFGIIEENYIDEDNDSINITSKILPNPEKPDKPQGPASGLVSVNYTYSSSTTDPNGDQVYYKWNWGNEISDWDGPYASGDIITAIHSWSDQGNYPIRIKAKDTDDNESPWSDPLSVTIPKNKAYYNMNVLFRIFLERFPFFEKILNQIL